MSRARKPPRLYLKKRKAPRQGLWIIRDGTREVGTGCSARDLDGAGKALERYLAGQWQAPATADPFLDEIIAVYLKEHAEQSPSRTFLHDTARPSLKFWSGKKLADVTGRNCRAYVKWRTAQVYKGRTISDQTARHDLKTLRAAIRYYHREHGPLAMVPAITMPAAKGQREDYFLSRDQVADRIRKARKSTKTKHVARFLLIGVYTGTRPGAIIALRWTSSTSAGWFDLDSGILHRRGTKARRTKKRQPPARIHARLLPHLRRWRDQDVKRGITHVVHYVGKPVTKLGRAWSSVAGDAAEDGPHIVRHTAATWQMQAGTDIYEAASYLGMSPETLLAVYGHHHPDFQSGAANATNKRAQSGAQSGSRRSRKVVNT
jgi:integrase